MANLQNNRIQQLFKNKDGRILSLFFTAGHPSRFTTVELVRALSDAGADMIEVGIPYSDPVADGPVIQGSSQQALAAGMTLTRLLDELKEIRRVTDIPLVLMGYYNTILQFGVEDLLARCVKLEIDGLIIPDLPAGEYADRYKEQFDAAGICNILMAASNTSRERIKYLDTVSGGFLYLVSAPGTTGGKRSPDSSSFEHLHLDELHNPVLVGFGIGDNAGFEASCSIAQGAIVGSVLIQYLESVDNLDHLPEFLEEIRRTEISRMIKAEA